MTNKIFIVLLFIASMNAMEKQTYLRLHDSLILENGNCLRPLYDSNSEKVSLTTFDNFSPLRSNSFDLKPVGNALGLNMPVSNAHVLGLTKDADTLLIPLIARIQNENDTILVLACNELRKEWQCIVRQNENFDFIGIRLYSSPAKKIIINALALENGKKIVGFRREHLFFSANDEQSNWEIVQNYVLEPFTEPLQNSNL